MTPQEGERQKGAKIAESRSRLTVDDYNRVLEAYLLGKRSERGYTDRDPSEYYITTSGESNNLSASNAYAFQPAMCI